MCVSVLRSECPDNKILTVEYPCVRAGGKNSTCFRSDSQVSLCSQVTFPLLLWSKNSGLLRETTECSIIQGVDVHSRRSQFLQNLAHLFSTQSPFTQLVQQLWSILIHSLKKSASWNSTKWSKTGMMTSLSKWQPLRSDQVSSCWTCLKPHFWMSARRQMLSTSISIFNHQKQKNHISYQLKTSWIITQRVIHACNKSCITHSSLL